MSSQNMKKRNRKESKQVSRGKPARMLRSGSCPADGGTEYSPRGDDNSQNNATQDPEHLGRSEEKGETTMKTASIEEATMNNCIPVRSLENGKVTDNKEYAKNIYQTGLADNRGELSDANRGNATKETDGLSTEARSIHLLNHEDTENADSSADDFEEHSVSILRPKDNGTSQCDFSIADLTCQVGGDDKPSDTTSQLCMEGPAQEILDEGSQSQSASPKKIPTAPVCPFPAEMKVSENTAHEITSQRDETSLNSPICAALAETDIVRQPLHCSSKLDSDEIPMPLLSLGMKRALDDDLTSSQRQIKKFKPPLRNVKPKINSRTNSCEHSEYDGTWNDQTHLTETVGSRRDEENGKISPKGASNGYSEPLSLTSLDGHAHHSNSRQSKALGCGKEEDGDVKETVKETDVNKNDTGIEHPVNNKMMEKSGSVVSCMFNIGDSTILEDIVHVPTKVGLASFQEDAEESGNECMKESSSENIGATNTFCKASGKSENQNIAVMTRDISSESNADDHDNPRNVPEPELRQDDISTELTSMDKTQIEPEDADGSLSLSDNLNIPSMKQNLVIPPFLQDNTEMTSFDTVPLEIDTGVSEEAKVKLWSADLNLSTELHTDIDIESSRCGGTQHHNKQTDKIFQGAQKLISSPMHVHTNVAQSEQEQVHLADYGLQQTDPHNDLNSSGESDIAGVREIIIKDEIKALEAINRYDQSNNCMMDTENLPSTCKTVVVHDDSIPLVENSQNTELLGMATQKFALSLLAATSGSLDSLCQDIEVESTKATPGEVNTRTGLEEDIKNDKLENNSNLTPDTDDEIGSDGGTQPFSVATLPGHERTGKTVPDLDLLAGSADANSLYPQAAQNEQFFDMSCAQAFEYAPSKLDTDSGFDQTGSTDNTLRTALAKWSEVPSSSSAITSKIKHSPTAKNSCEAMQSPSQTEVAQQGRDETSKADTISEADSGLLDRHHITGPTSLHETSHKQINGTATIDSNNSKQEDDLQVHEKHERAEKPSGSNGDTQIFQVINNVGVDKSETAKLLSSETPNDNDFCSDIIREFDPYSASAFQKPSVSDSTGKSSHMFPEAHSIEQTSQTASVLTSHTAYRQNHDGLNLTTSPCVNLAIPSMSSFQCFNASPKMFASSRDARPTAAPERVESKFLTACASSSATTEHREQQLRMAEDFQETSGTCARQTIPAAESVVDISESQLHQLTTEDFDQVFSSFMTASGEVEKKSDDNFEHYFTKAQTKAVDEIVKKKAEGKSLVEAVMADLVSINKQLLRMKREMEIARRKMLQQQQQQQQQQHPSRFPSKGKTGFGFGQFNK